MKECIIECVPNFSEGRNMEIIQAIRDSIGKGVLHVDVGRDANRTVISFAGSPDYVCEAAFKATQTAAKLIDMSKQKGEHPRIGATDVLPLIPISGASLEDCVLMARRLARRISDELMIPCYLYEAAAYREHFRNLASCRKGEYEGIEARIENELEKPDLGSRPVDSVIRRSGCTVVGARKCLIAVNFCLDSENVELASDIAREVREKGPSDRPSMLRATKAIGWYMAEYGCAQVSMNLTDPDVTSLHKAFLTVRNVARLKGTDVTATEIIGLIPEKSYEEAKPFLGEMRLDGVKPFDPDTRIIERLLNKKDINSL